MNLNKKIKKSVKFLEKFSINNKFDIDNENSNHIHVFLLYVQLNYNINLGFHIKFEEKPTLFNCLRYLYSDLSEEKARTVLFSDEDEILLKIFFNNDIKETKELLKLLITQYNSIEYVNLNVEILDYLGNTTTDVQAINLAYGLIWLKSINPELNIPKKFLKSLTKNLIEISKKNLDNIRYTNSEAILILFMLNRILYLEDLDNWIENFVSKQKTDGRWTNGYNSYFIDNTESYDAYHTVIGLLILLEYQTLQEYKNLKAPSPQEIVDEEEIVEQVEEIEEVNAYKPYEYEQKNLIEDFSNFEENKKKILEFEKVIPINQKYSINYNIYNITFLIILIFLLCYANKLGRTLPVQ